jgi:hypothetical protein
MVLFNAASEISRAALLSFAVISSCRFFKYETAVTLIPVSPAISMLNTHPTNVSVLRPTNVSVVKPIAMLLELPKSISVELPKV